MSRQPLRAIESHRISHGQDNLKRVTRENVCLEVLPIRQIAAGLDRITLARLSIEPEGEVVAARPGHAQARLSSAGQYKQRDALRRQGVAERAAVKLMSPGG
jgi:hypothetical protein